MNEDTSPSDDQLDQMLAELEENPDAPAASTVRQLHRELATLAEDLRQPLPPDPHEEESGLRRAAQLVREIGRDASPQTLASASDQGQLDLPEGDFGPYRLLGKLGQGGMGTVYKALHIRLEKVVALKVLPAERMNSRESVARFERETKAVGKLDHPHIVRAMDAGEADGRHYLVMEHVEGIDLSQLLKRLGPLPIVAAVELVRQAALGLQAAHSRGMVHRDIKPANLMLAAQEFGPPVVKLLDLGLARLSEPGTDEITNLTADGRIMGTIEYMAPEQAGDSHAVDIRADIYSLGATLYALLTGGSIFQDRAFKSLMQKLTALATAPVPPIGQRRSEVPSELAAVVHRMLARDPEERFATPAEVAIALQPFTTGADLTTLLDVALAESDGKDEDLERGTQRPAATGSEAQQRHVLDQPQPAAPHPDASPRGAVQRGPTMMFVVIAAAVLLGLIALGAVLQSLR